MLQDIEVPRLWVTRRWSRKLILRFTWVPSDYDPRDSLQHSIGLPFFHGSPNNWRSPLDAPKNVQLTVSGKNFRERCPKGIGDRERYSGHVWASQGLLAGSIDASRCRKTSKSLGCVSLGDGHASLSCGSRGCLVIMTRVIHYSIL